MAGAGIRLMLTGLLTAGYQAACETVHLDSFLPWMVILYLPLLAVETVVAVVMMRTHWRPPAADGR